MVMAWFGGIGIGHIGKVALQSTSNLVNAEMGYHLQAGI